MAEVTSAGAPGPARGRRVLDAVLLSYAQIFFSRNRLSGALLLLATFTAPALGAHGLAAVVLALGLTSLAHLNAEHAASGAYGFNALLCGLAVGAWFEPGVAAAALLVAAVIGVLAAQAALEAALGNLLTLPSLSLPFVAVAWLGALVAAGFPAVTPAAAQAATVEPAWLPAAVAAWLHALGSVFFLPGLLAGLLVAVAIAVDTRIGLLLSVLGFTVGWAVLSQAKGIDAAALADNSLLTAMALGGVWFVPQRSAFVLAALGAAAAALLAVAASRLLSVAWLPALIAPFNLVTLGLIYAARQRVRDAAPKAVDFVAGTPEVNLAQYRTRVARFGTRWARLALPFMGRWTVTQGVDGGITHAGLWRDALDFEVLDANGRAHAGEGEVVRDYHCYRLPVLAVADGRVVKVVRDVPDNAIGERNADDNWGNLVLLEHAVGLYSLVCHLSPGTVEVAEGQWVRQGARLGLCGNSGRSFVPHVHLQLQASPRVGAPTIELLLNDVVRETDTAPMLERSCLPAEGARVRNVEAREEARALFDLPVGKRLSFEVSGARGPRAETVVVRIDLFSNLYLESDRGDRLYFECTPKQFLAFDYQGGRESALFLWYAAVPRVPFELTAGLRWDDALARRQFRPRGLGWALDLADPFLGEDPLHLEFVSSLTGEGMVVRGAGRLGRRALATCARFGAHGLAEVSLDVAGELRTARLEEGANDAAEHSVAGAARRRAS